MFRSCVRPAHCRRKPPSRASAARVAVQQEVQSLNERAARGQRGGLQVQFAQMAHTPSSVLELTQPTSNFLCSLADNTFKIDFLEFSIRDLDMPKGTSEIFAVRQSEPLPACVSIPDDIEDPEIASRSIRYDFGASFLSRKSIGAKLVFKVGEDPLPGFRMIERHYFKDQLIKSFDFTLGFCMPNSTNEWEVMYTVPSTTEELRNAMIDNPFDTRSDTFYFVNDRLIMHNKAEYAYTRGS